jgi:formylglycine-generating enzyme required for sulfatase activity
MRQAMPALFALVLLLALVAGGTSSVAASNKFAFVVGIDRYDHLAADRQLRKAVNDARAVGETLAALGFAVTRVENADRLDLVRQWQRFLNGVEPGDVTAFFFAGHGVEISGLNYLVPRDVPAVASSEEEVLKAASLPLAGFLEQLRDRRAQLALVTVDACRDNPFTDARGRSLGATRGLARIDPPSGTFVMFSAGAGQTALDRLSDADPDPNSVYTRALVKRLAQPGLGLPDIARQVRRDVLALARSAAHEQTPAYYDEFVGRFCPAGCEAAAVGEPGTGAPADPAAQAWAAVKDSESEAIFEAFIARFPGTVFAEFARARLQELKEQRMAVGTFPEPPPPPPPTFRPGDTFKDCDECPEMAVVPAGSFIMGSPESEEGRFSEEGPQRRVTIARPFAVGKFSVTFAAWNACVADGGCNGHRPSDQGWGRGTRPAITVSWHDAQAYAAWLSRKTGERYRLLSEAEWEYAARAGTTTRFSCGDGEGCLDAVAWYFRNSGSRTQPVGQKAANNFGLHDMHGNVWEWTEDCWNDSYRGAPTDASAWTGGDCSSRVLRGGSWSADPGFLRSASRGGISSSYWSGKVGFRVARTITP